VPIFTKDGKILFVGGKAATDEACCCDGDSLFHINPDSLVPYTATTDFSNADNIWDRNKVWIAEDDGEITKNTGYVYTMHNSPSSNKACGFAPIIENLGGPIFGSSDDFYVRMDYTNLVMPTIAGSSYIPVRRFGIHFTGDTTVSETMNTLCFVGRGQFTNEQREIWRNIGDAGAGGSSIDNSTSGYFEWARSSGVMTLSHNGTVLSSRTSDTGTYSGPWFGWKNYFNAGATPGSARITDITVQKNDEDVFVLQKKWIDLIESPTNDAITPYLEDTTSVWYRPVYVENMKNNLDGLKIGPRSIGENPRYLKTAVNFPQNICVHAVVNLPDTDARRIMSNWNTDTQISHPSFGTSLGKIRLILGVNTTLTSDSTYTAGWYVVTGVFNGASSKIYINTAEIVATFSGSTYEAWDDSILVGDSAAEVEICKVRVTELMTETEIVNLHSELMTKYDIT